MCQLEIPGRRENLETAIRGIKKISWPIQQSSNFMIIAADVRRLKTVGLQGLFRSSHLDKHTDLDYER